MASDYEKGYEQGLRDGALITEENVERIIQYIEWDRSRTPGLSRPAVPRPGDEDRGGRPSGHRDVAGSVGDHDTRSQRPRCGCAPVVTPPGSGQQWDDLFGGADGCGETPARRVEGGRPQVQTLPVTEGDIR